MISSPILPSRATQEGTRFGFVAAAFIGMETLCRELRQRRDDPPDDISITMAAAAAGFAQNFGWNAAPTTLAQGLLGGAICGFVVARNSEPMVTMWREWMGWMPAQRSISSAVSSLEAERIEQKAAYLDKEANNLKWALR